jgi:hypothetical protein
VTDPTGESRERNRKIAENESARQTISGIRISGWAIVLAIGLVAFAWVMIYHR